MSGPHNLSENWVHLGLGATAEPQAPFDGMEWYARYSAEHESDGTEGRLVALHKFTADWDVWEMHPKGSEMVLCTSGSMELIQEVDGAEQRTVLSAGEYAINAPGIWHTADVAAEAEALFITAGVGTEHRQRDPKSA